MKTKMNKLQLMVILSCFPLMTIRVSEAGNVTFYVDGAVGIDQTYCGTQAKPCKTITYTVNNKAQQNNNTTINIATGTYNESGITIDKKNVILNGVSSGSTIISGTQNSGERVILAYGPAALEVNNITVKNGGWVGIYTQNANLTCNNTVVSNNQIAIIAGKNSSLNFQGGAIQDNSFGGLSIENNSTATIAETQISKTQISNNGSWAISVYDKSEATLMGATITQNNTTSNGSAAIEVYRDSSLTLWGGNVTINNTSAGRGITVAYDSLLTISSTVSINNMKSEGIWVGDSSTITAYGSIESKNNSSSGVQIDSNSLLAGGGLTLVTSNNGNDGIGIFNGGQLKLGNNSLLTSQNNANRGVHLSTSGQLNLFQSRANITNNPQAGIFGFAGSILRMDNGGSSIISNGNFDINLSLGSLATTNGNTIGTLNCDSSSHMTGDRICN